MCSPDRRSAGVAVPLLGERMRNSHITNVLLALWTAPDLVPLADGPPHPELINFGNTMLRWSDLATAPHNENWCSTVQLTVDWDPIARCPVYDEWVRKVLPPDCVDLLDEITGYLMMNGNPLHKAVLLKGTGRNGKGTYLRIIEAMIGERNRSAVDLQSLGDNRFRAADLFMKIANVCGDLDARHVESTTRFKMITGDDTIQAERKYGQPFEFTSWAVPLFSANKLPTSSDTSEGYLSRWEVVPFPVYLPDLPGGIDPSIESTVRATELPGIARRGVNGLRRLMARRRFERPPAAQEAFDEFEATVDQVRAWERERCDTSDAAVWTSRTELYDDYRVWAVETGHTPPLNAKSFYERLEQAGVKQKRSATGRYFLGIRLVSPTQERWRGGL